MCAGALRATPAFQTLEFDPTIQASFPMPRHACTALVLTAPLAFASNAAGGVLFTDDFANGITQRNDSGKAWFSKGWRGRVSESDGSLRLRGTGDHGNGGLISRQVFDAWTADGQTFMWSSGNVAFDRTSDARADFTAEFALINPSMRSPTHAVQWWNHGGGLYVSLAYESDTQTVNGKSRLAGADKGKQSMEGMTTLASFTLDGYDGSGMLDPWVHLSSDGATIGFDAAGLDVQWSDAVAGVFAGRSLGIDWSALDAGGVLGVVNGSVFGGGSRVASLYSQPQHTRGSIELDQFTAFSGNAIPEQLRQVPAPATAATGALLGVLASRRRRGGLAI